MKNLKLISILLAAGAIAACNKTLDETQPDGSTGPVYTGNKGYVNISLNLPTTSGNGTRANDQFDNGLAAEYNVNSAIIALFYGSDESTATCKWAFSLSSSDFQETVNDNPNNITSYFASGVRMIQAPGEGENVYALAILNPTNGFTVTTSSDAANENAGDAVLSTQLQVDGSTFSGALSALNTVRTYDAGIASVNNNGSFLMTNAPVSNQASFQSPAPSGLNVTTLAQIDVYTDKSLASGAASANPIYVERAVAKATVKVSSNNGSLTVNSEVPAFDKATVTFDGWVLQNTNKTYFPVHKADDWSKWSGYFNGNVTSEVNRFFSHTLAAPYRVYWAIDNNYSSEAAADNFNVFTNANQPGSWNSVGNNGTAEYSGNLVGYCAENTTIAQQMSNDQLTSVLLKSTFTPSGASDGDNFFMLNNTSEIYTEDNFIAWATAILANSSYALAQGQTLTIKSSAEEGKTITDAAGVKALLEISNGTAAELSDNQATTLITAAGNNIKFYKDGVTYYNTVVIAHFGDDETPLTNTVINAVTDYDEAKHLGRYGMVRNNWYELVINSVSGPGEPEIPEIPDTPVDQTSSYINCQINILSWAKRSQGVDL